MVLIDSDSSSDYDSMSFEEVYEEIKTSGRTEEGLRNMSWALYDLLPEGTLLRAAHNDPEIKLAWGGFGAFERAFYEKPADLHGVITTWPQTRKGETVVMFLGMTEELYPYEVLEYTPKRRGGFSPKAKLVSKSPRKYPKWLINERVFVYAPNLGDFDIMKMGSGKKAIKHEY